MLAQNRLLLYGAALFLIFLQACSNDDDRLFTLKSDDTIPFTNELHYTEEFNPYTYRNFYNGGGVALGDINNDGLIDVYFTGNVVDNKMFLNKGNWEFEDVTKKTGLACSDVWSSGACFVDINGDGLLDLYVCKAGKPGGEHRYNELFINKGNLEFEEQSAAYGLDVTGLSIQAAFFDYDRDGDLDCYLLNNSLRSIGGFDLVKDRRKEYSENGNKFFENRDGRFVDVSQELGIFSSEIGFGLGITLSDFNLDGWTDIYVSNDFFEKDYLYLNQEGKSFVESGESFFECFPLGSMGADVADLDNDLLPDLMITEMLPSTSGRKKTKAIYDSWKKYSLAVSKGYAHQFPRNMLQRNMGAAGFLEIGRKAGVEATNWSWSCLMQDFDNDGLKDIVVANGIYKDLLDRDYLAFMANDSKVKNSIDEGGNNAITKLIDAMPSEAVSNFAFKNMGDFNFENYSDEWGLGAKSFSNGCAYGDLDNDGDLDLVFNNVNAPSFVYENKSERLNHNFISISLKGKGKNTRAVGAKTIAYACGQTFMTEQYPSRGFQSSVSNHLSIGLGQCQGIDSLKIIWPNGQSITKRDVKINTSYEFEESSDNTQEMSAVLSASNQNILTLVDTLSFVHRQLKFNQFNRERLLFKMNTSAGPAIAVNEDGNSKMIFTGGGKEQTSSLFIFNEEELKEVTAPFANKKRSEVVDAVFFDSDQDGDQDLYIAHGGTAFSPKANEYHDVLYINEGNGRFEESKNAIPFSNPIATGVVTIGDYNNDGLPDLFVGDQNSNNVYGLPGSGYLFKNIGANNFELVNTPAFENLGIITDAKWADFNADGLLDLVVVGEWMDISIFVNNEGQFKLANESFGLANTKGLWNTVLVDDFNQDGTPDLFVGNVGENSAVTSQHLLYINDFDANGSQEQILAEQVNNKVYPSLDMDELMSQLPVLKRKYVYYKDYAGATMGDLFSEEQLEQSIKLSLNTLESKLYLLKDNRFEEQPLPAEVQFSSIHAVTTSDVDQDGTLDFLIGGNHYLTKPQFGRDDASKGWLLKGAKSGNEIRYAKVFPLNISGEIRAFENLSENEVLIGVNNQQVKIYKY